MTGRSLPSELKKSLDTRLSNDGDRHRHALAAPCATAAERRVDTRYYTTRYLPIKVSFFRANTAKHVRELGWKLPADLTKNSAVRIAVRSCARTEAVAASR